MFLIAFDLQKTPEDRYLFGDRYYQYILNSHMRKMRCSSNLRIKELIQGYTSRTEWKEYMEELYKKDLNEPDYHDGVISHPEPDILECEVKWALRSTAVNKASGCDEIPAELLKSLKEEAIKVLHSLCQQI